MNGKARGSRVARFWSFDRSMMGGFIAMAVIATATSFAAIVATRALLPTAAEISTERGHALTDAFALQNALRDKFFSTQAYVLTGRTQFLDAREVARKSAQQSLDGLRRQPQSPARRALLDRLARSEARFEEGLSRMVAIRARGGDLRDIGDAYYNGVLPARAEYTQALEEFMNFSGKVVESGQTAVHDRVQRTQRWVIAVASAIPCSASTAPSRTSASRRRRRS
jgi:hypothetical protein